MTRDALIEELIRDGYLKTPRIIQAFKIIDRKDFVLPEYRDEAYGNYPLPIGYGQTISQPLTVAFMFELLDPQLGQKILDVGFGSGWTTALLAYIVGVKGRVCGLEIIPEVFKLGRANLKKAGFGNVKLRNASGWDGWPEAAPSVLSEAEGPVPSEAEGFDRILVSAAASEAPENIKAQLKVGGKMAIPIGEADAFFGQSVRLITKVSSKKFKEEEYPGFAFVPLVRG